MLQFFKAQDTVKVAVVAEGEQQAELNYNLGIEALNKKEYSQAIQLFSECLLLKPNFDKGYANRAIAFTELKKYPEALMDINSAIHYNSQNPEYLFNKGLIFWRINERDSQLVVLNQCLEMNPKHPEAYYYKALLLL